MIAKRTNARLVGGCSWELSGTSTRNTCNSKFETRNSKQIRKTKFERAKQVGLWDFEASNFELVSNFEFRVSDFSFVPVHQVCREMCRPTSRAMVIAR